MYAVVVNADDLGYSLWRDEGIFRSFRQGITTSASLLVNGASAKSAAKRALEEGLDMGLHLNLTEGIPLTDCKALRGKGTNMMMYKESFWKACMTTANISEFHDQIILETCAQLQEFQRLTGGIPATHLDGHQHCHVAPGIAQILAPIIAAQGIVSTRIPDENIEALTWVPKNSRDRWAGRIDSARTSREIYARYGVHAPDVFLGHGFSGSNMSVQRILVSARRQLPLRGRSTMKGSCPSSGNPVDGVASPAPSSPSAPSASSDPSVSLPTSPTSPTPSNSSNSFTSSTPSTSFPPSTSFTSATSATSFTNPTNPHTAPVNWLPTVEIMVHPGGGGIGTVRNDTMVAGCGDGIADAFGLSPDRQHEANVLSQPHLLSRLVGAEHQLQFCNWNKIHEHQHHLQHQHHTQKNAAQKNEGRAILGAQKSRFKGGVRVLLIAIGLPASGNHVTALRIRQNMADRCNFNVTLIDANDATAASVLDTVQRNKIQVVVGLHAYHAGKLLYSSGNNDRTQELVSTVSVPVIIVAGGTDLNNEHSAIQLKNKVVQQSLCAANAIVVFNAALRDRGALLIGEQPTHCTASTVSKIHVVPQAVDVSQQSPPWLRDCLGLAAEDVLILLPSGIRPVKDPLFVVPLFQAWVQQLMKKTPTGMLQKIRLVVMGSVRDDRLMKKFREIVSTTVGDTVGSAHNSAMVCDPTTRSVIYHPPVSHDKLLAAMNESNVLLNTSLSEGMANVLLEAMALGTPVLARRNEGNCALVGQQEERGGLFATAQECIDAIGWHCCSEDDEKRDEYHNTIAARVQAAAKYIQATHSCEVEAARYAQIVNSVVQHSVLLQYPVTGK